MDTNLLQWLRLCLGVYLAGGEGSVFPKAFIGVLILTMIEMDLR